MEPTNKTCTGRLNMWLVCTTTETGYTVPSTVEYGSADKCIAQVSSIHPTKAEAEKWLRNVLSMSAHTKQTGWIFKLDMKLSIPPPPPLPLISTHFEVNS